MGKFAIGIDLGTTTSGIAYYDPDTKSPRIIKPTGSRNNRLIPSIVAVDKEGDLKVGETAKRVAKLGGAAAIREIKRLMGKPDSKTHIKGKAYRPEEVSALILKELRKTAKKALGTEVDEVVLSVPANFDDAAKTATIEAAHIAGLKVAQLVNEPTAAALAFGIDHADIEEQILVFDFGGGTLDITILEMDEGILDVIASHGDPQLGGKDLDAVLEEHIEQRFLAENPDGTITDTARNQLKNLAEGAKIALSANQSHEVVFDSFGRRDDGTEIGLLVRVSRAEFEEMAESVLERVRVCLREALSKKKVRPSSIDRVLLVGGSTYMPAVRRLVAERFGKEPRDSDVDPDLAVCLGAAVKAAITRGDIDPEDGVILTDVAPYGLGVRVIGEVGGYFMPNLYCPLIVPNTTIPYTVTREFSLIATDQDSVDIEVFQDHKGTAKLVDDAEETGLKGRIEDIPPSTSGEPHPVAVHFSYDTNGLIHVEARIPGTDRKVEIVMDKTAKRLSDGERQEAIARIDELWRESSMAREIEPLLARAEEAAALVDEENRSRIRSLDEVIKRHLADGDEDTAREKVDELTDLLFDLEGIIDG
jgi:molecular chaperone DnaK